MEAQKKFWIPKIVQILSHVLGIFLASPHISCLRTMGGTMLNVLGGWGAVFTWTQIFRYTRKGTDQMDVDQMTSPFEQFLDWCAFVLILAEEKKNEKMKINIQIWHFTALQHPKSYANNFLYLRGVFPIKRDFFTNQYESKYNNKNFGACPWKTPTSHFLAFVPPSIDICFWLFLLSDYLKIKL